ncbi:hypothetical protein HDV04_000838 [Boothiomyces sp. JEL0838]|nr:hypothetical protein HDV04_000838 [Boothiomyces sp. JEL0838]
MKGSITSKLQSLFSKSNEISEEDYVGTTETLTATQFAEAVGIKAIADEEQLTILSKISEDSVISTGSTCNNSYPKLDMNMFVPPPEFLTPKRTRNMSITTLVGEEEKPNTYPRHRRPSLNLSPPLSSTFPRVNTHRQALSANSNRNSLSACSDISPVLFEKNVVEVKKGRFSVTSEKSSHWYANVDKGPVSRFQKVLDEDPFEAELSFDSINFD